MNYFKKGRTCGVPHAGRPKSQKTIEKEKQEEEKALAEEVQEFNEFEKADSGVYCGYCFSRQFFKKYKTENAVFCCIAGDDAIAVTPFGKFESGYDGSHCIFFSKTPKKRVDFNEFVYFI